MKISIISTICGPHTQQDLLLLTVTLLSVRAFVGRSTAAGHSRMGGIYPQNLHGVLFTLLCREAYVCGERSSKTIGKRR
jgi:hypothetical protein